MTLAQLLNRTAWLVRRSDSGTDDVYGNAIQTESQTKTVCEVQQTPTRRSNEPDDLGEVSDTAWAGFLPAGTAVDTGDALIVDGIGEFEIVAEPWQARNPRTQAISHVELALRRVSGAEDGS